MVGGLGIGRKITFTLKQARKAANSILVAKCEGTLLKSDLHCQDVESSLYC